MAVMTFLPDLSADSLRSLHPLKPPFNVQTA